MQLRADNGGGRNSFFDAQYRARKTILSLVWFIAIVIAISQNTSAVTWKIRDLLEVSRAPRQLRSYATARCSLVDIIAVHRADTFNARR